MKALKYKRIRLAQRGICCLRQSFGPHLARSAQRHFRGAAPNRFSSSRKAVRFAGLDITVYSSAGKRSPGKLSRQGPAVLHWCLYEAGKAAAREAAPDHAYYVAVRERASGKRAALSQARRIVRYACHLLTALGDDAFTVTAHTSPARSTARRTPQPRAAAPDGAPVAAQQAAA